MTYYGRSPWNPSRHEYECPNCGCYSPKGEPCWSCEEDKLPSKSESDG